MCRALLILLIETMLPFTVTVLMTDDNEDVGDCCAVHFPLERHCTVD